MKIVILEIIYCVSLKHPFSEQHTAANDVRGKSNWGGCDDTGLLGMACRHDHCLRYINISQSGEKLVNHSLRTVRRTNFDCPVTFITDLTLPLL